MTVVWLVFSEYYDGETTWTTFHSAWADEATAREVCAKKAASDRGFRYVVEEVDFEPRE